MAIQSVQQSIINDFLSVAKEGNIQALYSLIKSHPQALNEIENTPFAETPLHAAASAGHASFAIELMMLKPTFAQKGNKDGFTPLDLALEVHPEVDHDLRKRRQNVVVRLVRADKALLRAKGKGGLTPLHYLTRTGNTMLVKQLLKLCPEAILDVTNRNETALHIALKHKHLPVAELLKKKLKEASLTGTFLSTLDVIDLDDEKDEPALDVAYDKELQQVESRDVRRFLDSDSAEDNSPSVVRTENKHWFFGTEDNRNALLLVVALLITITFQMLLTPPGGNWQDDYHCPANDTLSCAEKPSHRAGTAIMGRGYFTALTVLNVLSFYYSLLTITFLIPRVFASVYCLVPFCCLAAYFGITIAVTYPTTEAVSSKAFSGLVAGLVFYVYFQWFAVGSFLASAAKFFKKKKEVGSSRRDELLPS